MIFAATLLASGSLAVGLALFEIWALLADKIGVFQRIRDLILNEPDDTSDMAAITRWLELAAFLPIGIILLVISYAEFGELT